MIQTVEAVIDQNGNLRLLEPITLPALRRAFVTILDDEPDPGALETAMLSEPALTVDWNTPKEDAAWSHLAQLPSLKLGWDAGRDQLCAPHEGIHSP